jgi:DNA adenine methylase
MNLQSAPPFGPFLKWAGGKRWFIQRHSDLLPAKFNRYIEPFLGGGSVFFHLRPERALLGDINADLIAAYEGLRDHWSGLKRSLQYHQRMHSDDHYYRVRATKPTSLVRQASRMIYLNRTCFNGIFRVNLDGEFNVPRGTKNEVVLETDDFREASRLLSNAELRVDDFESLIKEARLGDLVFADPPYTVRHNLNGFIKYNEKLFSWGDQERLAASLSAAQRRGAQIVCTNANHDSVRQLYSRSQFNLRTTTRFSSISASGDSRRQYEELIVLSK